jgi:hypothetical protein
MSGLPAFATHVTDRAIISVYVWPLRKSRKADIEHCWHIGRHDNNPFVLPPERQPELKK